MKYEMVFGDDGLFLDAQKDCEMVGNGHHKVENGKLMVWNFTEKRWCNSHTNTITISAMRRIIKEPKRWTLEDKKAGRLPQVGGLIEYFTNNDHNDTDVTAQWRNGDELEILRGQNKNKAFVVFNKRTEQSSNLIVQCMNPIETPEERAQLEEDKFVYLVESNYNHMPNEISFREGIRAAYRKLKGGA